MPDRPLHDNDEALIRQLARDASARSRIDGIEDERAIGYMLLIGLIAEVIARRVLGIDTAKYLK